MMLIYDLIKTDYIKTVCIRVENFATTTTFKSWIVHANTIYARGSLLYV